MSLEGMDIDQAQDLDRQLAASAEALEQLAIAVADVAARLALYWEGPLSAAFEQDCLTRHRPALHAAAQALSELRAVLAANIGQQQRASAVDSGGGLSLGAVARDAWGALGAGLKVTDFLDHTASFLHAVENHADPLFSGRVWSELAEGQTYDDLAHSPGLAWLRDSARLRAADKLLSGSHVSAFFKVTGPASMGIGAFRMVENASRAAGALGQHHYAEAAGDFTEAVADGLKAFPDDPVTYLAGVDLTLLHKDLSLDWKDVPNPLTGDNFRQDYLPVIRSMGTGAFWGQAAKTLFDAM